MPKNKSPLPENTVSVIEKWALKKCNTDDNASQIVDHRIRRVCREIQATWTPEEEKARRVRPESEYIVPSYLPSYIGASQKAQFKPQEDGR